MSTSSPLGKGRSHSTESPQSADLLEGQYELLFENNPGAMWVYDSDSLVFLAVNQAAIEQYGYSRQEFLSMTIKDIRPPEEVPALIAHLQSYPVEASRNVCTVHRKKDDSLMDVEVTSCGISFGPRRARLVLSTDVSERKGIEQSLRRRSAELNAVLEALPDLYFQMDLNGTILDFNVGRDADLYARPETFMGRLMPDILPEAAGARFKEGIDRVSSTKSSATFEYSLPMPQGEQAYEARLLTLGEDRIIAVIRNVTREKQADEELRRSNDTLKAIIEASPLAIVAMDLEGKVKSWNAAAEQIFGWSEAEVLGRFFPIVPEDDLEFFWANIERAKLSGETVMGVERQRVRKDGTLIDVGLWNAVQRDAAGKTVGIISVIADIADRKRLEEQLRQSQKMEAVGRLAGGVAHDFNNLLTVVTGYSQMLLDKLTPIDPLRADIEEILKAGNRAAALTSQLLAFGRRQMIQPQVLDLNRVISDLKAMLRRIVIEDIDLHTALQPRLGRIRADRSQIEQVLMNLVVNARDAMNAGGRLTIETANFDYGPHDTGLELKPGRYILLKVSDTGEGMDAETQRRLFEPFFTTKALGKGTGLGLSTVYGIVKQHGGDIRVLSRKEYGTTFEVYLPRTLEAVDSEQSEPEVHHGAAATGTILLVEDEAAVRRLTCELLVKQGYKVIDAADGLEALRKYEQRGASDIDVLITDVVMPHMGGQELARRLAELQPGLKIIFLSGYSEMIIGEHGLGGPNAPEIVQKPFTASSLGRKVREVLNAK